MKFSAKSSKVVLIAVAALFGQPAISMAACQMNIGGTGTITVGVPSVVGILGTVYSDASNNYNTCLGGASLTLLTTGLENTAVGYGTLTMNTEGSNNTAIGSTALLFNSTGNLNTASGNGALRSNTSGSYNTSQGAFSLYDNVTGGFNTAAGSYSLNQNTTGSYNVANGSLSLFSNTTGDRNAASGAESLRSNTTGANNSANGASALFSNTTGSENAASGRSALNSNTTGNANTADGAEALSSNTTGNYNIALGYQAGANLTTGSDNIVIGSRGVAAESATIRLGTSGTHTNTYIAGIYGASVSGGQAVVVNSSGQLGVAPAIPGNSNVALGGSALVTNSTGNFNTAAGTSALASNSTGSQNTASGAAALGSNTTGNNNTANGGGTLASNTTGSDNTASGAYSLYNNTTGSENTTAGNSALQSNTTGNQNVAIGFEAAKLQTTGSANTAIGYRAGLNWTTGSNNIAIANPAAGADAATIRIGVQGVQTRAFISGIRGVKVSKGQAVFVDANGQLGVAKSSGRYKEGIQPMGDASHALMQLRPVTFRYKQAEQDGTKPLQYGLIAEQVEQVMPELVIYNNDGTPESVAYDVLPSLLLNEHQKQSRELEATRAELAEAKARLDVIESQVATMKLMLSRFADSNASKVTVASMP